jgi:hypothetical protein
MIVTPAQAGVQLKAAWIPACAGMTGGKHAPGKHAPVIRNILNDISGTQH